MKSRLVRFGIVRSIYVGVVSAALVITAVRTFATGAGPDSSVAADSTSETIETAASGPGTSTLVPALTPPTTMQKETTANGNATTPLRTTTTVPHTGTTVTVPAPPVTTAVPDQQYSPSTTLARSTTTAVPTTTTTIYRPGSIVMVIPAGTQARINRGEDVSDVLPLTVNIKVGQYIYLVNKDNYFYSYGPLNVMPLDTTPFFFSVPGTETGYCTISKTTITFNITA